MRERGRRGFDVALAGVVAAVGQLDVWAPGLALAQPVGAPWVNAVGYLLAGLVLVWRRHAPLAVLAAVATVSSIQYLLVGASQGLGSFLPLLVAIYSVGRYAERRAVLVAGPIALLGVAVHELRDPHFEFGGIALMLWAILAAGWPLGQAFRARDLREAELAAQADRLERERDARARAAVAQERGRIARELHDVVGHSVSVIVVQAVAAAGLLDNTRVDQARERVSAIEETARQALAEMRRLVGLLDESAEPAVTPQPGLGALNALLDQLRTAGLPVELRVQGNTRALPPGLDLAAFRIIQEALTNTLKHAAADTVRVTVRYEDDALDLEVHDDGRGPSGEGQDGGRGLVGMRQRAALYGGELSTGPCPQGGYQVHARLPLGEGPR